MQQEDISKYYKIYEQDETMKDAVEPSGYFEIFRFADKLDILLMIIGTWFSLASGVSILFYSRPFGQLIDAFSQTNKDKIVADTLSSVHGFLTNSIFVFVFTCLSTTVWMFSSERQMNRARKQYFMSIMMQQTAWHDRNRPQQLSSKMFNQIQSVHQALMTTISSFISKLSITVFGVGISMYRGWQMSLVMIGFIPVMMISGRVNSWLHQRRGQLDHTSKISNQSEVVQIFENIQTVRMLGGQQYQQNRFYGLIDRLRDLMISSRIKTTLGFAFMMLCIYMNYAIGFYYGAKLVSTKTINDNSGRVYTASDVLIIFFTLYLTNLNITGIPDLIGAFRNNRVSMKKVLAMVDRKSRIIQGQQEITQPINQIIFNNITFRYEKPLFEGFNLVINKGMTALIGQSGNGKTTLINLIMRFYDVFNGSVLFKCGNAIKNINQFTFKTLREKTGYVGQQPVLIGKTIRQVLNAQNLGDEEVEKVLRDVKAWRFTSEIGLDKEYNKLSGGQKQRIAIARALLRKPEILILDEGTSALDRRTQQDVLKAIKKYNISFVFMISHRVETLINADNIIKLESGKIVASGNYQKLLALSIIEQSSIDSKLKQNVEEQSEAMVQIKQIDDLVDVKKQQLTASSEKIEQPLKPFKLSYIKRLMAKNSQRWYLFPIGFAAAAVVGSTFPIFSYLLSQIAVIISGIETIPPEQLPQYQIKVNRLSTMLFVMGTVASLMIAVHGTIFEYFNQMLRSILKKTAFKECINKPMTEIDRIGKQNLVYVINVNCDELRDLGSNLLVDFVATLATLVTGLTLAFYHCWQISFVSLVLFPLVILCGVVMGVVNGSVRSKSQQIQRKTHQLVVDTVINHKTIKSLNIQDKIIEKYSEQLDETLSLALKGGIFTGLVMGLGQSLISVSFALVFYIGAILIQNNVTSIINIYIAIYAVQFTGVQAGMTLGFIGRITPGKHAASRYFQLVQNEQSDIRHAKKHQDYSHLLSQNKEENMDREGDVQIFNLQFKYQSRDNPIFENLNLHIKGGQRVALVGQSGSGKSTIANLLFRIYEPQKGSIKIDGIESSNFDLRVLRRYLGIVSQQPILFNRSVYENIKYNIEEVTIDNVLTASKQANAYDFICQGNFGLDFHNQKQYNNQLKQLNEIGLEPFKKKVGSRGSYLSGGQKQRIAIARALVRKPSIIVLDEATSALDNQNQRLVQEALEKIKGITQIIIAHRLSTVQSCDRIIVLKEGKVVEQGNYKTLISKKGQFYNLANALKNKQEKSKNANQDNLI